ncbi:MAG: ATP-binding protein [Chloroflexota bacterium]|nr:ATP-binding protein [Chloroflexota bacterium]
MAHMEHTQVGDVERLGQALGELPEPMVAPPFIVVSGLPGSGKSYLCRRLEERLHYPIIESDAMRKVLFPVPSHSLEESARLFSALHLLIAGLLGKGIPLIFDATNLIERNREELYRIAARAGARLIMVRVEAPPEVVRQRLAQRQMGADPEDRSDADWQVYRQMRHSAERIRRNHFAVDTSRDIAPAIDRIVRAATR